MRNALKKIFIIGPDSQNEFSAVVNAVQAQCNAVTFCFLIGNGTENLKIEYIKKELSKHAVDASTQINVIAHGNIITKEQHYNLLPDMHAIALEIYENGNASPTYTHTFLDHLRNLFPHTPLQIHLFACHAAFASKESISHLRKDSVFVTYGIEEAPTSFYIMNYVVQQTKLSSIMDFENPFMHFYMHFSLFALMSAQFTFVGGDYKTFNTTLRHNQVIQNAQHYLANKKAAFEEFYTKLKLPSDHAYFYTKNLDAPLQKNAIDIYKKGLIHQEIHKENFFLWENYAKQKPDEFKDLINSNLGLPALTPLCRAATYNKIEHLRFLLDHDANVNLLSRGGDKHHGSPPLYYAVEKGNVEAVKILTAISTIDVNQMAKDGTTPLCAVLGLAHLSKGSEYIQIIKILSDADAHLCLFNYRKIKASEAAANKAQDMQLKDPNNHFGITALLEMQAYFESKENEPSLSSCESWITLPAFAYEGTCEAFSYLDSKHV